MSEEVVKGVPEEFTKVIKDFIRDVKITFPEYNSFVEKWWKDPSHFNYIEEEEDRNAAFEKAEKKSIEFLFDFCQKKIPPRFFDILYQNDEMFKDVDTEFLPRIHFKNLWQCDISEKTRETIWKYLQLILFSIVGSLENKDAFGDTAKLFEAINVDEFKSKLEETLNHMQGLFESTNNESNESNKSNESTEKDLGKDFDLPNPEHIHDHISGILDGKLGKLAKEIAEETAADLNMDFDNATDMKDVFQNLIKNPTKLMGLVKNVGNKLDSKIKSGDLKETELIAEATDIMNKMKNIPGMGNIQSMLSKMGLGGAGGGGGKMNMGAMEANLNQRMKMAKMKERMQAKAAASAAKTSIIHSQSSCQPQQPAISDEELVKLFSSTEKPERTPRGTQPETTNKKKKKGKK